LNQRIFEISSLLDNGVNTYEMQGISFNQAKSALEFGI